MNSASRSENWAKYVSRIDHAKIAQATQSLMEAYEPYELKEPALH